MIAAAEIAPAMPALTGLYALIAAVVTAVFGSIPLVIRAWRAPAPPAHDDEEPLTGRHLTIAAEQGPSCDLDGMGEQCRAAVIAATPGIAEAVVRALHSDPAVSTAVSHLEKTYAMTGVAQTTLTVIMDRLPRSH